MNFLGKQALPGSSRTAAAQYNRGRLVTVTRKQMVAKQKMLRSGKAERHIHGFTV